MEWKELWLFGGIEKKDECNVNLLNDVLSHARRAVQIRRNIAHFEGNMSDVWQIMKRTVHRDINLVRIHVEKDTFCEDFVDGSRLVEMEEEGALCFNFERKS